MPSKNTTPITAEHILNLPQGNLDFYHQAAAPVHGNQSAYELYCLMTNDSPWWLQGLFKMRDTLSAIAGVQKIDGFRQKDPQLPPTIGQRLEFWEVHAISHQELILTAIDRHLGVVLSIAKSEGKLALTTRVKNKNAFGRLYMLPVAPMHGWLVQKMLKNVTKL